MEEQKVRVGGGGVAGAWKVLMGGFREGGECENVEVPLRKKRVGLSIT